jgi:hypothetical protein
LEAPPGSGFFAFLAAAKSYVVKRLLARDS